ncbi:MAG: hypothetical protein MIO92_06930, partial [Methanosarcinaceae archaeon]|nr:hypothetical protein [Methanosarcinaceae archaeon]
VKKIWLTAGFCLALVVIGTFFVPGHALCGAQNDPDAEVVLQAAKNYLDAEVRKDYPAVYACFAPSSSYVRNHSYEQYLADARSATDRVVSYRIVDITYIKNYDARKTSSAVDKISEVEVDVTFFNADTQYRSEVNIGFIFLKERGRWYKS